MLKNSRNKSKYDIVFKIMDNFKVVLDENKRFADSIATIYNSQKLKNKVEEKE